jgi:polysaccharide biosynthesis transport protein
MELMQYVRLLQRWLWLLLLAAFIGGSISFIAASRQPVVYRSQTILAIGGVLADPNPNAATFTIGPRLLNTYARLVRTYDVLQATAENLDFPITPGQVGAALRTNIIPDTLLLELVIVYRDPVAAADIANELANQLILATPNNLTPELEAQITVAEQEINKLTQDLIRARAQLDTVNRQLENTEGLTPTEGQSLQEERRDLVSQINDTSGNIASFQNLVASVQGRINTLDIVEAARVAAGGSSSNPVYATILGAVVGLVSAIGLVVLLEYLNDTFRNAGQATQVLGLPVLGVIGRFGRPGDSYRSRLITEQPPLSRTPEEYRTLRTNLLFKTQESGRIFVVSSASPQEGKSVTAANLAVSMALAGQRVVLIDADLRRPRVHQVFGVSNELGLTTLLSATPPDDPNDLSWREVLQETNVPGLRVITSGFLPKNPAEILGSQMMKSWVTLLRNAPDIDVVLFDSPPCLAMSDSTVLAASIDADVVLVVQANSTRRTAATRAKERFVQVDATVIGIVLNGSNLREEDYYDYAYQYYYRYDTQSPTQRPRAE